MIHIARQWRVFAGGTAAGLIGVMVFAGARASADPVYAPPPVPSPIPSQAPAAPVQTAPGLQGGVNTNRFAPTPTPPLTLTPAPAPAAASAIPPAVSPAVTGTLREYLQGKGVKLEPQRPQGFKPLDITLPVPPRWTQVPDPNVPDAFAVIADRVGGTSVYTSNAQVVVYKLVGNFDPAEAITHGYVDSQRLLAWQTTNASMANFGPFPSSVIEGTYRENDMTLNTSRRHVIATSGTDKYLVSFSVTTAASQAISDAPATDAIINGFRVVVPGTTAPATPAPAPTTPAPAHTANSVGLPAQQPVPAPVPAQVPASVPVQAPASVPVPAAAPAPAALPVPATAPVPAAQAPTSGPVSNLLSLAPWLPPLPNLHLTQR